MAKTLTAHTLVKNEDRYVWFSVMSVIDYVDKVMIWDTGSTDSTIQIIKELQKARPDKVEFREYGNVDILSYTKARQEILAQTKTDWFLILDGDEVWWDGSVKEAVEFIQEKGQHYDTLVHRYINPVGDIYHVQPESAHKYKIDNSQGAINIRYINMSTPHLSCQKPHGQFGYYSKDILVQDLDPTRRRHFQGTSYMHFTNMPRSTNTKGDIIVPKRSMKLKYEIGIPLPYDFYYPEVFFKPRPDIVPSPWVPASTSFKAKSLILNSPRTIKRRLIESQSGY